VWEIIMPHEPKRRQLSDEWRTIVIDAVEHGMSVSWERDPEEGEYLEIWHPARVGRHVTTHAQLDEFLRTWSSPWDKNNNDESE
jgi:hypothetical protein